MKNKLSVLFVCIHNSARSQMAEAFLRKIGGEYCTAKSAGLEAGQLNPVAVEAMREIGIDISGQTTDQVDDLIRRGRRFDYVITVCDATNGKRCPIFPGKANRLHWNFDDPAELTGPYRKKIDGVRRIRKEIRQQVSSFLRAQGFHNEEK